MYITDPQTEATGARITRNLIVINDDDSSSAQGSLFNSATTSALNSQEITATSILTPPSFRLSFSRDGGFDLGQRVGVLQLPAGFVVGHVQYAELSPVKISAQNSGGTQNVDLEKLKLGSSCKTM